MLNATLGGLIKDFRIKKNLPQLEVAMRLGWKDATRLSKIEQGHQSISNPKLLNKIMEALELNQLESGKILANSEIVPSISDFEKVLPEFLEFSKHIPFPVYICDLTWKTFYMNNLYQKIYKISDDEKKTIIKNNWNWLEVIFLLKNYKERVLIKANNSFDNLKDFDDHMIALFKFSNGDRSDEKWYKQLMQKLSKDDRFRELWSTIEPYNKNQLFYQFEINTMESYYDEKKIKLSFMNNSYQFTCDTRFTVIIQYPMDKITADFCHNNFKKSNP